MPEIAERWTRIRQAVEDAARRAGRQPAEVRIIAASKTKDIAVVHEAIAAGVRDFGENYVQEAESKIPAIREVSPDLPITWHMIGHLQRNKARKALELFDVVHTVDNARLGRALDRYASERGIVLPVLLEVNIAGETTKTGAAPDALAALRDDLGRCEALSLRGLMTMPPPGSQPEDARPYFARARELAASLHRDAPDNAPLEELSMGMSNDFTVAVEEGATMVRIGTALLGVRPAKK